MPPTTGILRDIADNRVHNVKTMAANIAKFGEGKSVREFLDALALASGSMICAAYKGPGVEQATSNYLDALRRALNNNGR